ncbi:MFS transporter [Capillimicrobium parvum]|uniref:MFS-type transporter YcaD n=1 Tax=Capillimicrobium parvum TaxID=2884022 RepID=A0A9E6XZD2_9ACTN|nr:MFS transporter [Capillimicrobium parvum]UGS37265.1 putative MFS-type transporter YcaD [Capillimicrobium parvum]
MSAPDASLRRLSLLAAVALILESALYSAVAPLLPHYRDEFDLSKSAAGVLTAAYAVGMVFGSIAGGIAAGRAGPRRTVVGGFALLGAASVVFGLAGDVMLLDAARAAQGFGAGLIWSGVLAWLIAAAPDDRRGQVIGTAMGAAIFGTLFGPVLGTVAVAIGPETAFGAIAICCAAIIVWVVRTPGPARRPDLSTDWARARRSRLLIGLTALSLMPGIVLGALNALVPLRLDDGGFGEPAIGATFLVGALVAAATAPLVGRRSDRDGRVPLIAAGLAATAPALVVLGLVQPPGLVAALTVVTFGVAVTVFSIPLMALLSEVAEASGLTPGPAAALLNLTFASGEAIGAPASALGADLTSDAVPFVILGAVALVAMLVCVRHVTEPRAADAPAA